MKKVTTTTTKMMKKTTTMKNKKKLKSGIYLYQMKILKNIDSGKDQKEVKHPKKGYVNVGVIQIQVKKVRKFGDLEV